MSNFGDQILKTLDEIKQQGITIERKDTKDGPTYVFGDDRYEVAVTVNPLKWLGLEFTLHNSKIWYPIDTDLYNPTHLKNRWFTEQIEDDIVTFLSALKNGDIKIAFENSRPRLIVPLKDEYVFLKRGRFNSSAQRYNPDGKKAQGYRVKGNI